MKINILFSHEINFLLSLDRKITSNYEWFLFFLVVNGNIIGWRTSEVGRIERINKIYSSASSKHLFRKKASKIEYCSHQLNYYFVLFGFIWKKLIFCNSKTVKISHKPRTYLFKFLVTICTRLCFLTIL